MISSSTKGITCLSGEEDFRYLKGTKEFGLWYPKGKDLSLIAYTDVDWVGCIDDQRSTSGDNVLLG
jgi:hypothetical protein